MPGPVCHAGFGLPEVHPETTQELFPPVPPEVCTKFDSPALLQLVSASDLLAESSKHTTLVQTIISYIGREHSQIAALGIVNDLSSPLHAEKPNRIDGFVPDVYAFDAPLTTVIIGEAKTQDDLETEHSRKQITAYLSFLGHQQTGIFILAVPWQAKRRARAMVEALRAETGATSVKTVTLDDIAL